MTRYERDTWVSRQGPPYLNAAKLNEMEAGIYEHQAISGMEDISNWDSASWHNSGLIYSHTLGKWVAMASGGGSGVSNLSDLTIDVTKDWNAYGIYNLISISTQSISSNSWKGISLTDLSDVSGCNTPTINAPTLQSPGNATNFTAGTTEVELWASYTGYTGGGGATAGQVLAYNGTYWIPSSLASSGDTPATWGVLSAGTGIGTLTGVGVSGAGDTVSVLGYTTISTNAQTAKSWYDESSGRISDFVASGDKYTSAYLHSSNADIHFVLKDQASRIVSPYNKYILLSGQGTTTVYSSQGVPGQFYISTAAGTASPAGSDTQIQFNDGGSFGADELLYWNKTANKLYSYDIEASNEISSNAIKAVSVSCNSISCNTVSPGMFVLTPTTNQPALNAGTVWCSGSATYAQLYFMSANNGGWCKISMTCAGGGAGPTINAPTLILPTANTTFGAGTSEVELWAQYTGYS